MWLLKDSGRICRLYLSKDLISCQPFYDIYLDARPDVAEIRIFMLNFIFYLLFLYIYIAEIVLATFAGNKLLHRGRPDVEKVQRRKRRT